MTNIPAIYRDFIQGHHVTTDSRNVKEGDVFIALKGESFDGNGFAAQALADGANVAIIDNEKYKCNNRCIVVPDTLIFLQQVARHHRRQLDIPILGITGTNGKTTTKELCHAVLAMKYKTFATQGNFNNHIGVPLTLLSMDATTEFGIVEMGANHPEEIKQLCEIAEPDLGLITNIGRAHLEGFGSYENIIKTKNELYDYILAKGGTVFVNSDDSLLMQLSEHHTRILYGKENGSLKGEIKQSTPYLVYSLKTLKGDLYVKTHLIGGYNFDNAMAASCIGNYFNIDALNIRKAIEEYRPSNLRSQLIQTTKNTLILDAYNANPSSMTVAVSNYGEMKAEKKIAILGEMRELGTESEKAHRELYDLAMKQDFSQIFLIGKSFDHCPRQEEIIQYFEDTDALIAYLEKDGITSSYVLIKGSRGNKLERVVAHL